MTAPLRRAAAVILLLLCGSAARAQAADAACPPQPVPLSQAQLEAGLRDARDHGFLWRIRKNGLTRRQGATTPESTRPAPERVPPPRSRIRSAA